MGLEFGPADTFPKNTWSYYFNTVTYRGKFTVSIYNIPHTHTHTHTVVLVGIEYLHVYDFSIGTGIGTLPSCKLIKNRLNNAVAKQIIFHAH